MRHTDKGPDKRFFRSAARVFRMNQEWYFAAREGEHGPFPTEREAHHEMQRFAAEKQALAQFQQDRQRAAADAAVPLLSLEQRIRGYARARPRSARELMI